jgi:carbon storage regulator
MTGFASVNDNRVNRQPDLTIAGDQINPGRTMLVLSRKVGEKILIGDKISVTVVRVAQGIVRIGVEAPQDLPIVREEIKGKVPVASPKEPAAS